jgi:hypothetical protein
MDEREPDLTEDPRRQGTASGGYPESNPADETTHQEPGGEPDDSGAPSTSSPEEGGPGQATGNPGAAG